MEIGMTQGRKAYQLSLVLSGFEISLLCLSLSQSFQQQQSGDVRRERGCDRGRECAIRKSTCQKDGEVAMTTTYTAGCQSRFEGTNEGRRGVRKARLEKGHFSICLLSQSVNLTVRLGDKDKL